MAKAIAYCTCSACGREFTKETVKSNSREARSWESWAEGHFTECPECEAVRIKKMHDEENAKASAAADAAGLPELLGSPKQIAWGTTIRQKMLDYMQEYMEEHAKRYDDPADIAELHYAEAKVAMCRRRMLAITNASWFINNRRCTCFEQVALELKRADHAGFKKESQQIRESFEAEQAMLEQAQIEEAKKAEEAESTGMKRFEERNGEALTDLIGQIGGEESPRVDPDEEWTAMFMENVKTARGTTRGRAIKPKSAKKLANNGKDWEILLTLIENGVQ